LRQLINNILLKNLFKTKKLIIMKKFVLFLGLMFAMQTMLMAQLTDTASIHFNAHLWKTFTLTVVDGGVQEITFQTAADYNNGVTEAGGIAPGFSNITVEATGNWWLTIQAPDFVPYVGGPIGAGTGSIPINNLGVWCEATGVHQFGTEVTCTYISAATALGLTIAPPALPGLIGLNAGNSNSGAAVDNAFRLHWLMGTMQGSMNNTSMFTQMALTPPPFTPGDYTTAALLTLTEIP
jgi:hypothetical protein